MTLAQDAGLRWLDALRRAAYRLGVEDVEPWEVLEAMALRDERKMSAPEAANYLWGAPR